jgi:exodeoxyribonuclease V alpha subunit
LWVLKEAVNSGHLFLYDHQIIKAINVYNQGTTFKFKSSEITLQDIEAHLIHLENEGYLVRNGDKYYEVNLFFYENESARILSLIANKPDSCDLSHIDTEKFIEEYELSQQDPTKPGAFKLSEEQRDAIRSFIKEKILIVTGSPGTGKTTIIKSFVELMIKNKINFDLLTPTGIASKKLGVTAGYEAYTIHRKLGYKGNSWDYNINNKYDTSVAVIDEMSMVDMEVFYRLVSALYTHTKLVFVGDNDQLPSVGPGRVLNELIKSNVIKTISLKNIFRQEEQSDIIKEAKKIREGDIDLSLFKSDPKADIWFIRNQNIKELEKTIIKLAKDLKDQIKAKGLKKTFQIITPRNSGPLSVDTLNIALQESLNPKVEGDREIYVNGGVIRIGDRVLIRKNDYQLGVFNGDIGKVIKFLATDILVEIDDYEGKKEVNIPIEIADELLKLAYAITVHKAEGMEYDLVLLPFIKFHGKRILQRNLLYTAITRARKKIIVFGQGSAIVGAIENDKIQERNTLFSQRIAEWMENKGTSLRQLYNNPSNYQNAETLKQLLLFEERASAESGTTSVSLQKRLENSESQPNYTQSSHRQSSKQLDPISLEKVLQTMEEKFKDLEELPF